MLALWAASTCSRSMGPAIELISADRARSVGSTSALTSTILVPCRTSATCTSPNWLGTTGPLTVRVPPGAAVVVGPGGPDAAADVGGVVGWVDWSEGEVAGA